MMTEKNMILNERSNRASVIAPFQKEIKNPLLRNLKVGFDRISNFITKWVML
jgi:hypothetical protein